MTQKIAMEKLNKKRISFFSIFASMFQFFTLVGPSALVLKKTLILKLSAPFEVEKEVGKEVEKGGKLEFVNEEEADDENPEFSVKFNFFEIQFSSIFFRIPEIHSTTHKSLLLEFTPKKLGFLGTLFEFSSFSFLLNFSFSEKIS